MKTILVAEDDANIRSGLTEALEADGYRVVAAQDGSLAVEAFEAQTVDLVLLDIMMPVMNGYDVCRRIREKDTRVPVLMLSAKTSEIDQVLGLELGADDYIEKPFRIRELLARIHTALRRIEAFENAAPSPSSGNDAAEFVFGRIVVDERRFRIRREDGSEADLTERELCLLKLFFNHPEQALTRDFLLNEAWGIDYQGTTRTLDQHIAKLRAKIEPNASASSIRTVHGVGYRYQPQQ